MSQRILKRVSTCLFILFLVPTLPLNARALPFSFFIPGLRQLQSGQTTKGLLFLATFAGCTSGALIHNHKGNNWFQKYRDSLNVPDIIAFRQSTEKHLKKRNLFLAGALTLWLAHVIDLKFLKSNKKKNQNKNNKKNKHKYSGFTAQFDNNHINLGVYYLF